MASRNGGREDAAPGGILLVVHDFVARSPDELSLAKGDRIELIERDDDFGDGWFLGRHMTNGNTGLFPEVYTTPAPRGTLSNPPQQRRVSAGTPKPQDIDTPLAQQRYANSQQRPSSANQSQTSPLAQTALRSSLPSPNNPRTYSMMSADSPVMNETLSVINEHITDMHTPRQSFANGNKRDTQGSMYSQPMNRLSYIMGHETDEEEHDVHTEDEVMAWGPERVAEYLEDHGVEKAHCEVFKEQEISGEVLLAMDQSSVFIKEFELGPVGRRLKTWHKIKALQDEVRRAAVPNVPASNSGYSGADDDAAGPASRNRSASTGNALPRALSTRHESAPQQQPTVAGASNTMSPLQSMTSITSLNRPENTHRPSAQSIRSMNHSRRHSSIDSTSSHVRGHRKQPSFDQKWTMGQAGQSDSYNRASAVSTESAQQFASRHLAFVNSATNEDADKAFSSTESDGRTRTNGNKTVLAKRSSNPPINPEHSRNNSANTNARPNMWNGRLASSDSLRQPVSPMSTSTSQFGSMNGLSSKVGGGRINSSPQFNSKTMKNARETMNPVVTKLDYDQSPSSKTFTSSPGAKSGNNTPSQQPTPSPSSNAFTFSQAGFKQQVRAISDAITRSEKTVATDRIPDTVKEGEVQSPTRPSTETPSTDTTSLDYAKTDAPTRASTGSGPNLAPPPPATTKRAKAARTKKQTSAYTRGLQKLSPAEQMSTCDYSGWMKKKSGSLMTTWKPRLFVLRGCRLSYYYSETDTEEKGLIDISFHRVLPADNEKLTSFHASLTNAASKSPTSPNPNTTSTTTDPNSHASETPSSEDSLFIFKLQPPKSGLSKGVTFTKPMVHYFAVPNRSEGRLWMAAMMKATIDRDEDGVVTTTYNQETISLAKARARRERPPALKEKEAEAEAGSEVAEGRAELEAGLGIQGLGGAKDEEVAVGTASTTSEDANAGAEEREDKVAVSEAENDDSVIIHAKDAESGSNAPGAASGEDAATGKNDTDALDEKEREAVALNTS
ncbi:hypothetical protein MBLNU230_g8277t1 [Neophaeotheca triangularis]